MFNPDSYTHMTLPTMRMVSISLAAAILYKKVNCKYE